MTLRYAGIDGRVALVTGAGQGMGRAIAERLATEGAKVAANDLDPQTATATAEAVGGIAVPFDVSEPDGVEAGVADVESRLGPVELLVANHAFMTMAPFEEESPENWRRILDVNLFGTGMLIERCAPGMAERGFGRIVVIASEWGVIGWPNATAYAASKGGLISLVKSTARAVGAKGVSVNAIAPGVTDTPQLDVDALDAGVSHEEIVRRYGDEIPLGRVGLPEEIAATVAFLCSTNAEAFVGQVLHPNGATTRVWGT
jgi:NAD(P)-dependent dehydrogenase (short-subunit alcohol dehydrogenase family)